MFKKVLVLILVLGIAGSASATVTFNGSVSGDITNASNWTGGLPFMDTIGGSSGQSAKFDDTVYTNAPVMSAGSIMARGLVGVNNASLTMTGGNVEARGFWFGDGGTADATWTQTGGYTHIRGRWGSALELGYAGGSATVNISGGTIYSQVGAAPGDSWPNEGDTLNIPMSNGGRGEMNISGNALVDVPKVRIRANGFLDIAGEGRLVQDGDRRGYWYAHLGDQRLFNAVMSGQFTANGTQYNPSLFNIWYDSGANKTIINVPEPATIALLGLGGLALIRRKR